MTHKEKQVYLLINYSRIFKAMQIISFKLSVSTDYPSYNTYLPTYYQDVILKIVHILETYSWAVKDGPMRIKPIL